MARLHEWFRGEREHGHEVRAKTINMRLKYELEYERDKELVLKQLNQPEHLPHVLQAAREKLQYFAITGLSKQQDQWLANHVRPRIGATARGGQRMQANIDRGMNREKGQLTWATSDRFIHVVARGTREELQSFVSNPDEWALTRENTEVVVVDATALWLKLRGEDKVFISADENITAEKRMGTCQGLQEAREERHRAGRSIQRAKAEVRLRSPQRQGANRLLLLKRRGQIPTDTHQHVECAALV